MKLVELLAQQREAIVSTAMQTVERSHLSHYERVGEAVTRERLQALFGVVEQAVGARTLTGMVEYSRRLARERHSGGCDLGQLLTAINVLEETIWRAIMKALPPAEFAEAFALVSTVLGAGKDALACTYVELATQSRAPALDLQVLFRGTQASVS